jgi:hypothetical protein
MVVGFKASLRLVWALWRSIAVALVEKLKNVPGD